MTAVKNSYFINRKDYYFRPLAGADGLSGEEQLAVPKKGSGASYLIKNGERNCACNEFIGLRLAAMFGANVPKAYLVTPKKGIYAVAIEYLTPIPKPDLEQVKNDKSLLHAYVYGVIAHSLFEDRDVMDFLFSDNKLYTFDFSDGFRTDDLRIDIMENASKLASTVPADFFKKFILPDIDYQPKTLYAYETLVVEDQVCDKAYFDAALNDICSRFLAIPDEYINGLLCTLGTQYPDALITHFEHYIGEIRKFCQK